MSEANETHTADSWTMREADTVNSTASDRWIIECVTNVTGIKGQIAACAYRPHANLIASAPDLLDALESYVSAYSQAEHLPRGNRKREAYEKATAAIKAAREGK